MQIQMVWSPGGAYRLRSGESPATGRELVRQVAAAVPEGYRLRTYCDADRDAYAALMREGGFEGWTQDHLKGTLARVLPGGLFFLEHLATGELAATASAQHRPTDLFPFGGELGWVAARPEHRGKRLGKIASAAAVVRLLDAGYDTVYLSTDEWRLAAVKIYLDLGFRPVLYLTEMEERWNIVCRLLEIDPNDLVFEHRKAQS